MAHPAITLPISDYAVLHNSVSKYLRGATPSPWAILLTKFADDPSPDPDKEIYRRLFTDAGLGTNNMVKFFADVSHGKLDLSGSTIFGWYRLAIERKEYLVTVDRNGLRDAAKAAAIADGVDFSQFAGLMVSMYSMTDLCGWVGGMTTLCDQFSLQPSLLGQEMGHGYGLDHARKDGSLVDYQDPWDVMSTAEWPTTQPDADYTSIGPGLNAWNMRSRGWLEESRVWSSPGASDTTITLRPLHRIDLPGLLAAQLGPFLVELRVAEGWDAGIGQSRVLVHRFEDNHSYLMTGTEGEQSLAAGSAFQVGNQSWPSRPYFRVEVTEINDQTKTATLRLSYRAADPPRVPQYAGTPFGAIDADGGGIFLLPGGRVIPLPPRGPVTDLIGLIADFATQELSGDVALGIAQRRSILNSIVSLAAQLYDENDVISEPPPRGELEPAASFADDSPADRRHQAGPADVEYR